MAFAGSKSCIVPFRLKESELAMVDQRAATEGVNRTQIILKALDMYLATPVRAAQLPEKGGRRSPVAGSKRRPASSTAKVKRTSSSTPKKST